MGQAAGPSTIAVSGDLEELTGKPVMLNVTDYPGPTGANAR